MPMKIYNILTILVDTDSWCYQLPMYQLPVYRLRKATPLSPPPPRKQRKKLEKICFHFSKVKTFKWIACYKSTTIGPDKWIDKLQKTDFTPQRIEEVW